METTRDNMKKTLDQLDSGVLACTSKALEFYFERNFLGFVEGCDRSAYIEYCISIIIEMPDDEISGQSALSVLNRAVKMAKEQASYSRV